MLTLFISLQHKASKVNILQASGVAIVTQLSNDEVRGGITQKARSSASIETLQKSLLLPLSVGSKFELLLFPTFHSYLVI